MDRGDGDGARWEQHRVPRGPLPWLSFWEVRGGVGCPQQSGWGCSGTSWPPCPHSHPPLPCGTHSLIAPSAFLQLEKQLLLLQTGTVLKIHCICCLCCCVANAAVGPTIIQVGSRMDRHPSGSILDSVFSNSIPPLLPPQVPAPARAKVAVMAEGRELVLVLERNQ